ncbi:hypothetical protein D0Z03_002249 [Geotrichum reessii]|nr:hypothetical protein D0Z03_002249 [Galactomyces reessii]
MSTFDLDDEPHQFEIELLSSTNGNKTRIQSKSPYKGVSSGGRKDDLGDQDFVAKRTPPLATISSGEPSVISDSVATTTNEEEENYFRHARDELPKLTTLNHHHHLYSFETHDAAPGPSIGWGEPPEHSVSAHNRDHDDNVNKNNNENNYVEEEGENEEDETPAQLLSTRPVLHDLGNSGIGPTQQSTFAKGIFD